MMGNRISQNVFLVLRTVPIQHILTLIHVLQKARHSRKIPFWKKEILSALLLTKIYSPFFEYGFVNAVVMMEQNDNFNIKFRAFR